MPPSSHRPHTLLALLILIVWSTPLWAQKDSGSLAGVVRDSSSAVVAGAKVTVTDVDRGTEFVTKTNSQGEYLAGPLKVGRYQQNWDFSVYKQFPIREEMHLEFRSEFFNIWNHVNPLLGPVGAISQEPQAVEFGTPQFGQAVAARDPRFVQFALKFYF